MQHLESETHQSFVQDPDNYTELMGVIKSLPSLADLEYEEQDEIYDKVCTESPKKPRLTDLIPIVMRCNELNEQLSEQF